MPWSYPVQWLRPSFDRSEISAVGPRAVIAIGVVSPVGSNRRPKRYQAPGHSLLALSLACLTVIGRPTPFAAVMLVELRRVEPGQANIGIVGELAKNDPAAEV